jgi:prepilin-type N-terminal cleavage/methylation domain-containing protein
MNPANPIRRRKDSYGGIPLRSRRPCGYSLVEMLIVVTIASLILTSVAVALHSLFRVDRELRQELVQSIALTRISLALRMDAHEAISATLEPSDGEPQRILLARPQGQTVSYTVEQTRILRQLQQGDQVKHREVYPFPEGTSLTWRIEELDSKKMVILDVVHHLGEIEGASDSQRRRRIEAVVALDADYAETGS